MNRKKDVTVKLDGKYKEVETWTIPVDERTNNKSIKSTETNDMFQWKTDHSHSTNKEKIVDLHKRRRTMEELRKPFWDDGKSDHSPKLPPSHRKKTKRSPRTFALSLLKNAVFLAVSSAVVIGGVFGMLLLSMLSANGTSSGADSGSETAPPITSITEEEAIKQATELSSLHVYVVQAGAFSTIDKAKDRQRELSEKDIPSMMVEEKSNHYLFIGAAENKERAKSLAKHYESIGVETYVKPFNIESRDLQMSEETAQFFSLGATWIGQLAEITEEGISGEETKILTETLAKWEEINMHSSLENNEAEALVNEWMAYGKQLNTEEASYIEIQEILLKSLQIYDTLIMLIEG
ncbi:SPOR domain-containing protein [Salipaludibacillus agaradhaerens]|uniref:SPOR domain-containing protein n=1 Tax=Salipaludibacillus agaradhaerens TaxID=76935 RepID=A0A9Q4B004_SALAG|nr:SPOR domain-containing protein [Salipaludibacillus agaradhaerens]MCR6095660.1 SPOR domain-containing protein [Salipaludibacillus agaradhaerens]MCR6114780.1 SPOR domain-containing protein [Salipaludibacillus agaradhaerens]